MNTVKQKLDLKKVRDIVFDDIEKLLDSLDLEYEVSQPNIFMKCPIHGGDNDKGLSISLKYKNWRCWTRGCHEDVGKDIFSFISTLKGTDFSGALKYICKLYNVNEAQTNGVKDEPEESQLGSILKIFNKKPIQYDTTEPEVVETLNNSFYFEKRGFLPNTLEHFGVKDCIDKTSSMYHRAIIPVTYQHKQVGYIARSTKKFIEPKYLFSTGFHKANFLYNYDLATESAADKHALFLVEGQGDVWRMYEAGIENCVGLFGKDLSEAQERLLVQAGVTYLVVLTDNDQAGREGRIKIQRKLSRMFNLIYPPMQKKDIGDMTVKQITKHILPHVKGLY